MEGVSKDKLKRVVAEIQNADLNSKESLVMLLHTVIQEIGDIIYIEDIPPTFPGISIEVLPVIIKMKLMSRHIQLNKKPRGRKP